MSTTEKIREALAALDPTRDEDWTSIGLPSMQSVRALAGDGVTRPQVEGVAPGFTRDNRVIPASAATGAGKPTPSAAVPTPSPDAVPEPADEPEDDDEAEEPEEPETRPGTDAPDPAAVAAIAGMRDRVAALKKGLPAKLGAIAAATADIERDKAEIAQLDAQVEAIIHPPKTPIERYREVVARGMEERRRRAAMAASWPPSPKSKLDQVMAASGRRGLGMKRPVFIPPQGAGASR